MGKIYSIRVKPDYEEAYYHYGELYAVKGRLDKSIAAWKKTIELNPGNTDAYFNLGVAYYNQEKLDKAISLWNKVLEINPTDYDARVVLRMPMICRAQQTRPYIPGKRSSKSLLTMRRYSIN